MEDFFPKKPFFERLEFMANLAKKDGVADKIHLIVQYPLIKQGEILGKAFGTKETFQKLQRVAALPEPFWTLTSAKHEQFNTHIFSNRVLVGTLSQQVWPTEYDDKITWTVSTLRLLDLTVTRRLTPSRTRDRHLTFFLVGPRDLWFVNEVREVSFTGEATRKVTNSEIELDQHFPFEVEVLPYYFHDEGPEPNKHEFTANVLALHFKTAKSRTEFPDESFVDLATGLASDLCVLVSFISRSWVTWYRYELVTNDCIKDYVRETRECSTEELGWRETSIERHESREFLKTALTNYRRLRENGFDLFTPILYFVSANEKTYLEEQFTTLFLSLEKIKDLFARQAGLLKNLGRKDFEKLESSISEVIKAQPFCHEVLDRIKTKIPELNRPSFRFVLERLLSSYNIDWKDIYPPGSPLTLIKTRDQLFHSSREVDLDRLARDRQRLQVILERLLLRLLGWEDLSRLISPHTKRWLVAHEVNRSEA